MSFPVIFENHANGTYPDAQVYVMVLFQPVPGQWCYLKSDGAEAPIDHRDADAPGHLTKNGVKYPNMGFTLAELPASRAFPSPPRVGGGRIYVSLGSPMFIAVSVDNKGWAGPDLRNPQDPNIDVVFDWYEYAYAEKVTAFGGNTTQVDQFGLPLTARLVQESTRYDRTVGIANCRADVLSEYAASVGPVYQKLLGGYRIVAPRSASMFYPGGSEEKMLRGYIDQVWQHYTLNPFRLQLPGAKFHGQVSGDVLEFQCNGAGPYRLAKPCTIDVLAGAGTLACGNTVEHQLGAQFCAAFNRGVALDTTRWYDAATYYAGPVCNEYARYFHRVSLDNRAYGFSYDDVNDQSSVCILPNAEPPTSLTLGIGY